jgi:hypothetical protein
MRLPPSSVVNSTASRLIQRRATWGSFGSVFFLRSAGAAKKDSSMMESIFTWGVVLPLGALGIGGLYRMVESGRL